MFNRRRNLGSIRFCEGIVLSKEKNVGFVGFSYPRSASWVCFRYADSMSNTIVLVRFVWVWWVMIVRTTNGFQYREHF